MPADTTVSAPLQAAWARHHTLLNVRGDAADPAFVEAVSNTLGLRLPVQACTTVAQGEQRMIWAGPDDWFFRDTAGAAGRQIPRLREALQGQHTAVTDVSSGYAVLSLAGGSARDVLAQGCPIDLHPRAFAAGQCVGTHFFKASVWLWQAEADRFELLVRSSFTGYVTALLERCTLECGITWA